MGRRARRRRREAERTFNEIHELVRKAIEQLVGAPDDDRWVWVRDLTDEWVVYELEGAGFDDPGPFQATYAIDDEGDVATAVDEAARRPLKLA